MKRSRVRCSICHKEYAGIIPKGGDGSALVPWMHYFKVIKGFDRLGEPRVVKVVCPGSYTEAQEVDNG